MTTFDLMFEDSLSRTFYIFLMPAPKVTGTTDKWCVEQPAGWRQLCCWNWGGIMTTEDEFIIMPSKIMGIERYAVPPNHHAYNKDVGLLLDDNDNNLMEVIKDGIANGDVFLIRKKESNDR